MFDQWLGSLLENIQRVLEDVRLWLKSIADSLNPMVFIPAMAAFVASYLPEPDQRLIALLDQMDVVFRSFIPYMRLIDFFANFPALLLVISVFIATESALFAVRAWRLIRSFIT